MQRKSPLGEMQIDLLSSRLVIRKLGRDRLQLNTGLVMEMSEQFLQEHSQLNSNSIKREV